MSNSKFKPFVSRNVGHDYNPKAPQFKGQEFWIEGENHPFDVAIFIRSRSGEEIKLPKDSYVILKMEDSRDAEVRRHEAKMYRMEGQVPGTDGHDEAQELRKVVAGDKVSEKPLTEAQAKKRQEA